jgi:hypothetical protein
VITQVRGSQTNKWPWSNLPSKKYLNLESYRRSAQPAALGSAITFFMQFLPR